MSATKNFDSTPLPHLLGMRMDHCSYGDCAIRVTVAPDHLNLHGTAHGGLVFALADTAFGMAANAGAERAVTQEAQIHYLSPAQPGEELVATARLISRSGRTAVLDVTVTAPDGRSVALFRGQARFVG